eukprot:425313_1
MSNTTSNGKYHAYELQYKLWNTIRNDSNDQVDQEEQCQETSQSKVLRRVGSCNYERVKHQFLLYHDTYGKSIYKHFWMTSQPKTGGTTMKYYQKKKKNIRHKHSPNHMTFLDNPK